MSNSYDENDWANLDFNSKGAKITLPEPSEIHLKPVRDSYLKSTKTN